MRGIRLRKIITGKISKLKGKQDKTFKILNCNLSTFFPLISDASLTIMNLNCCFEILKEPNFATEKTHESLFSIYIVFYSAKYLKNS